MPPFRLCIKTCRPPATTTATSIPLCHYTTIPLYHYHYHHHYHYNYHYNCHYYVCIPGSARSLYCWLVGTTSSDILPFMPINLSAVATSSSGLSENNFCIVTDLVSSVWVDGLTASACSCVSISFLNTLQVKFL